MPDGGFAVDLNEADKAVKYPGGSLPHAVGSSYAARSAR